MHDPMTRMTGGNMDGHDYDTKNNGGSRLKRNSDSWRID